MVLRESCLSHIGWIEHCSHPSDDIVYSCSSSLVFSETVKLFLKFCSLVRVSFISYSCLKVLSLLVIFIGESTSNSIDNDIHCIPSPLWSTKCRVSLCLKSVWVYCKTKTSFFKSEFLNLIREWSCVYYRSSWLRGRKKLFMVNKIPYYSGMGGSPPFLVIKNRCSSWRG